MNNAKFEHLYFDYQNGKQITKESLKELKDEQWDTWNCIFGWPVQGIWPPSSLGMDINSVDRSQKGNQRILVTGDDYSYVKLFRYPSAQPHSAYAKFTGHSSHVTNVRFTLNDEYVISTGGKENSIIQWKVNFNGQLQQDLDDYQPEQKQPEAEDIFQDEVIEKQEDNQGLKQFITQSQQSAPSSYKPDPKRDNLEPKGNLTLSYIHGIKCRFQDQDCRNMCKYIQNNRVVFAAAAVGVIMDPKTKQQSFFIKHKTEIMSIAVHPKLGIVATGAQSANLQNSVAEILVWDTESKSVICQLNDFHVRGVNHLDFSPDGIYLLSAGIDDDNSIAIYNWQQKKILASQKVDKYRITSMVWKNNKQFVSCDQKNIIFWTLEHRILKQTYGQIVNKKFDGMSCCATLSNKDNFVVTGGFDGALYVWDNNYKVLNTQEKAHAGAITSIVSLKQQQLLTAGADGKVYMWVYQNDLKRTNTTEPNVDLKPVVRFDQMAITSLDCKNDMILLGTRGAQLFEVKNIPNQAPQLLLEGHYEGEVWGCAVFGDQFVTAGGDRCLRLWDLNEKKMILCSKQFENEIRALDWSSNGQVIVCGDIKSFLIVVDPKTLTHTEIKETKISQQKQKKTTLWIEDIKISPDNQKVAFGSHGGPSFVEIFEMKDKKLSDKGIVIQVRLNAALTHLDWSKDSNIIAVNSLAQEIKFINCSQKKDVSASSVRDVEWNTWSCTLGWPVQGIYPGVEGCGVMTCYRNKMGSILATGDEFSKVKLFQYPVVTKHQLFKEYQGHSQKVTRVMFNSDESYLISLGGSDRSVFVWQTDFSLDDKLLKEQQQIENAELKDQQDMPESNKEALEELDLDVLQPKQKKLGAKKFDNKSKPAQVQQQKNDMDIFEVEN